MKIKSLALTAVTLLHFLISSPALSKTKNQASLDIDFAISFPNCTFGTQIGKDFKSVTGDPYAIFCKKKKRSYECKLHFTDGKDGSKGNVVNYDDNFEGSDKLIMNSNAGADFILVDKTTNSAQSITRVIGESLGSKICSGVYLTSDELDLVIKEQEKLKEPK